MTDIDRRFMAENPGVTVDSESFQLDQCDPTLERRLAASDLLDIISYGTIQPLDQRIQLSDLLDLTAEPWVEQLAPEAPRVASDGPKIYGLPVGKAAIGVVGNKTIFARLGIAVPST